MLAAMPDDDVVDEEMAGRMAGSHVAAIQMRNRYREKC